ncbi:MAG: hypothetical protein HS115_20405 [Spirochaetales bacterium]|nr:hypothetical protein [Spirochaetales bacterium]
MGLSVLLALVRREYRLQYAGSVLGTGWLLLEYVLQVGIFYFVFRFVFQKSPDPLHLVAGMLYWLPLAELFVKTASSLSRNRALIRRTALPAGLFSLVPLLQAIFQFFIFALLALPLFRERTTVAEFLLVCATGTASLILFSFPARIFAWQSVVFRDLTTLIRMFMPALFWTLPIVYQLPLKFSAVLSYHPLAYPLTVIQNLLADSPLNISYIPFVCYGVFFLLFYFVGRLHLSPVARDEL